MNTRRVFKSNLSLEVVTDGHRQHVQIQNGAKDAYQNYLLQNCEPAMTGTARTEKSTKITTNTR